LTDRSLTSSCTSYRRNFATRQCRTLALFPARRAVHQLESDPFVYWHLPIIIRDMPTKLGDVIGRMTVKPERPDDDVIHHDMILVWGPQRRIITGSDLLARLLRDIASVEGKPGLVAAAPAATRTTEVTVTRVSEISHITVKSTL
jgi:hypothetical protein